MKKATKNGCEPESITGLNFTVTDVQTQPNSREVTLRDQFAMHALAELISLGWGDWVASGDSREFSDRYPEMALEAYRIADAMMAARSWYDAGCP
jgi:hypothetical protein